MTRDLAWGLEVEERIAERIKRRWGTALRTQPVPVEAGAQEVVPPEEVRSRIGAIGEARQQEILELVAQALQWGITRPSLASGIILTGGGARLRGTDALAEQVFGVRAACRRLHPDDRESEPDSWATAYGLVHFALDERPQRREAPDGTNGIWGNVQRWIGRLV